MKLRALIIVALAGWAAPSSAYWAPNHVDLNRQVFKEGTPWQAGFKRGTTKDIVHVTDYVSRVLYVNAAEQTTFRGVKFDDSSSAGGVVKTIGTDAPHDFPNADMTLEDWNAQGGPWEDGFNDMKDGSKWGGRRAVNHFHDPLSPTGAYSGFTLNNVATGWAYIDLLRGGISVTEWVLNGSSGGRHNDWGYLTVGDALQRAFGVSDPNRDVAARQRESALAAAFRSLGQVEHLLEDNTVPDHTRDLAHPGRGWEEYMGDRRPELFGATARPWVEIPLKSVEAGGIRAFWDRDVYSASPSVTLSETDPPGLSEFVNANFFAWNLVSEVGPLSVPVRGWSTIPDVAGVGWSRSIPTTMYGGLITTTRTSSYPWPRLADHAGNYYAGDPGSLPMSPAAMDAYVFGANALDPKVWKQYEQPLMRRAHGYAQSALSLALQPARAEILTDQNGDFLSLTVRLWNLWPTNGPNSVTWHVDSMMIVGVGPYALAQWGGMYGVDDRPLLVEGAFDVAPGASNQAPINKILWPKRAYHGMNAYQVVLVNAHLGDAHRTPLKFAVPIPNAFPLIKQTGAVEVSPTYTNTVGNCSTTTCSFTGENGVYRNPLKQDATGTIESLPHDRDVFGNSPDANLRAAINEDARISEVMLFAWPHVGAKQDFVPVKANKSHLLLTGNHHLKQIGPGHWIRDAMAPDVGDQPISFTATLDLSDFYVADTADPTVGPVEDAARAAGTVFIGVLTTAGAFYAQHLVLWPLLSPTPVDQLVAPDACKVLTAPRGQYDEDRVICHESGSGSPCAKTYTLKKVQTMRGDYGGGLTEIPTVGDPLKNALPLTLATDIRPTEFAGIPVTLSTEALLPWICTSLAPITSVWPEGNGVATCGNVGPPGLELFAAENSGGSGNCPAATRLAYPHHATYKRIFFPETLTGFQQVWGGTQAPAEWTFELK